MSYLPRIMTCPATFPGKSRCPSLKLTSISTDRRAFLEDRVPRDCFNHVTLFFGVHTIGIVIAKGQF